MNLTYWIITSIPISLGLIIAGKYIVYPYFKDQYTLWTVSRTLKKIAKQKDGDLRTDLLNLADQVDQLRKQEKL